MCNTILKFYEIPVYFIKILIQRNGINTNHTSHNEFCKIIHISLQILLQMQITCTVHPLIYEHGLLNVIFRCALVPVNNISFQIISLEL